MITTRMIPVNSVLKDVYFLTREHNVLEDMVMEFAIRGMEFMSTYKTYERAVCILHVENNTAKYPLGMLGIEGVLYTRKHLGPEDIHVILTADVESKHVDYNKEHRLIDDDITFKLAPFRQLQFGDNHGWQHLPISVNAFDRSILCAPEPAGLSCGDWWMPDNPNNRIITSFENGMIAVAYLRYPQDDEGNFLIPDNPIVHEALESYVFYKIYQRLWHASVQGAESKVRYYGEKWQLLSAAAVGELSKLSLPEYINLAKQNRFFKDYGPEKVYGGFSAEKNAIGKRSGFNNYIRRL